MTATEAYEIARRHFKTIYKKGMDPTPCEVGVWCHFAFKGVFFPNGREFSDTTICKRIERRILKEFPPRGDGRIRFECELPLKF